MDIARFVVRKARPADYPFIEDLLSALGLTYPAMELSRFWVGEWDGDIVATAELKDFDTCSLLSAVGVREQLHGRGLGRALVDRVFEEARHPVYLYTLIPGFFRKAGFRDAASVPADLPPRSVYGCTGCDPSVCFCLVRTPDGS